MKILNTIGSIYTEEAKELLKGIGDADYLDLENQEQLKEIVGNYEIAVIGLGLNYDKEVIDAGRKLKIIATASTGTDHIDLNYARKNGVTVLSLKNDRKFLDSITGTAELAFLLTLALMRNFLPATKSTLGYCWADKFRGHNLYKKTLGIVGLGRLGTMMARYGNAFGMKVIACDPYLEDKVFSKTNCKKVDFDVLLKSSDIISIHVHLSEETKNMFDSRAFELMKKEAIIVNTSRGKIVNEKDILDALKKNKIAGYATDVLSDELNFNQKFENNALIKYAKRNSNVIVTPHVGGVTFESREATDIFIAKKVIKELNKSK
ncbi:MAG: 4-phosphoerythronate dehydrogenase [Patescibacteria group bacterium]|nr:4-phosphoerythronate dehydrogenase [Patescibacteria group bacterium]